MTLDDLKNYDSAVEKHAGSLLADQPVILGEMFCTHCGSERRMRATILYPKGPVRMGMSLYEPPSLLNYRCTLCSLACVQCDTEYSVARHVGQNGPELVILSSTFGGLATPRTPPSVAYYLDQAHKSHSVGANSAAMAMFRAALEQLLYEQGFTAGMLNQKIQALEAGIKNGTAPAWARDLDVDYLKVLKDLGNGAIHTNGGDVTKQAHLDGDLIAVIKATFAGLLQFVYEIPQKKAASLAALKAKAALLK